MSSEKSCSISILEQKEKESMLYKSSEDLVWIYTLCRLKQLIQSMSKHDAKVIKSTHQNKNTSKIQIKK